MRISHALALGLSLMFASPHLFAAEPTPNDQVRTTQPPPLTVEEKVDINVADQVTLERLPGVGPKLAQAILTYREAHGEFVLPADVMKVPGIREGRFAQIKPWITADTDNTMLWRQATNTTKPTTKKQN